MESQQPIENDNESKEEDSIESTTSEDVSDTSMESEGTADVSYLLLEEKVSEGIASGKRGRIYGIL